MLASKSLEETLQSRDTEVRISCVVMKAEILILANRNIRAALRGGNVVVSTPAFAAATNTFIDCAHDINWPMQDLASSVYLGIDLPMPKLSPSHRLSEIET